MNKKNLWFLTLFSLVLVLSIYYVTMPNDLLLSTGDEFDEEKVSVTISEGELISALRITKEEERVAKEEDYQAVLTSSDSTTDEKNVALELIKSLNEQASLEDSLEKKIKNDFSLDCCVDVENSSVVSTCLSSNHDNSLANNIMRTIQDEFDVGKYITIKFES